MPHRSALGAVVTAEPWLLLWDVCCLKLQSPGTQHGSPGSLMLALSQEQHRSLVASLLQCAHDVLLPLPDNDGLLPMGMAVACNEVLTAAIFFMHPK